MWKFKNLPRYIDWAFCLLLLPTMLTLLPIEKWLVRNPAFVYILVSWLYITYLLHRKIVIPNFFSNKKHLLISLLVLSITIIGTYFITQYQMDEPLRRMPRPAFIQQRPKIKLQQQGVWFLYFIVSSFGLAIGLLTELYRQKTEKAEIEFEKKKAELALYKAQINPHFLFNTLNTLYAMVIIHSPKVEETFMQFIHLMKYMYSNNNKDKIPVQTEIEYIKHYIELQKNRISGSNQIHFSYAHDDTHKMQIAPMILITFVENLFKHGISSCTPVEAYITIQAYNGELSFSTNNPRLNIQSEEVSNGIGIFNCKKRLELLYPNKHKLTIEEKENNYAVTLLIDLKE